MAADYPPPASAAAEESSQIAALKAELAAKDDALFELRLQLSTIEAETSAATAAAASQAQLRELQEQLRRVQQEANLARSQVSLLQQKGPSVVVQASPEPPITGPAPPPWTAPTPARVVEPPTIGLAQSLLSQATTHDPTAAWLTTATQCSTSDLVWSLAERATQDATALVWMERALMEVPWATRLLVGRAWTRPSRLRVVGSVADECVAADARLRPPVPALTLAQQDTLHRLRHVLLDAISQPSSPVAGRLAARLLPEDDWQCWWPTLDALRSTWTEVAQLMVGRLPRRRRRRRRVTSAGSPPLAWESGADVGDWMAGLLRLWRLVLGQQPEEMRHQEWFQSPRTKSLLAALEDVMEWTILPNQDRYSDALAMECVAFWQALVAAEPVSAPTPLALLRTQFATNQSTAEKLDVAASAMGLAVMLLHRIVIAQHVDDHDLTRVASTLPWNPLRDALVRLFDDILRTVQLHRRNSEQQSKGRSKVSFLALVSECWDLYTAAAALLLHASEASACRVSDRVRAMLRLQLDELATDEEELEALQTS